MADLKKTRVILLDAETGKPIEDVDILTSPECIMFPDGRNLSDVLADSKTDLIKYFGDGSHVGDSRLRYDKTTRHWYFEFKQDTGQWIVKFEVGGSVYVDVVNLIACDKPRVSEKQLALYSKLTKTITNGKIGEELRPYFVTESGQEYSFCVATEDDKAVFRNANGELITLVTEKWLEDNRLNIFYVAEDGNNSNDGKLPTTAFLNFEPVINYLQNDTSELPIEIRVGGKIDGILDLRNFKRQSISVTGKWKVDEITSRECFISSFTSSGLVSNLILSYITADSFSFKGMQTTNQLTLLGCIARSPTDEVIDYFGFLFGNIPNATMRNCGVSTIKDAIVLQNSSVDCYNISGEKNIVAFTLLKQSSFFTNNSTFVGIEPNNIEADSSLALFNKYRYSLIGKSEENGNMKVDGVEVPVYTHPSGTNPHGTTKSDLELSNVDNVQQMPLSQKGIANGIATLNEQGKVPSAQLPSYVDSALEFPTRKDFPPVGKQLTLYLAKDTKIYYRWGNNDYIPIPSSSVQSVNGRSGNVSLDKKDVGLDKVDNIPDLEKFVEGAKKLICTDMRDNNFNPDYYMQIHGKSVVEEFKDSESIELKTKYPEVSPFVAVATHTPWSDKSGGYPVQVAYGGTNIYTRSGIAADRWSEWFKQLNVNDSADYVIATTYVTGSFPTWSRLYKSGWVEQGGYATMTEKATKTITFTYEMADQDYDVKLAVKSYNGGSGCDVAYFCDPVKSGMTLYSDYASYSFKWGIKWSVSGPSTGKKLMEEKE